jgi:hypothetical protein
MRAAPASNQLPDKTHIVVVAMSYTSAKRVAFASQRFVQP